MTKKTGKAKDKGKGKEKDKSNNSLNVAVIGGGTGFTAAYLINGYKNSQVTVFEKEADIGGNVQSPEVEGLHREAGAEFLGPRGDKSDPESSDRAYRDFHRFLDYLDTIKIPDTKEMTRIPYNMTMALKNHKTNDTINLPPIYASDEYEKSKNSCMPSFLTFFGLVKSPETDNKLALSYHTLLHHFNDMITLKEVIDDATNYVKINHLEDNEDASQHVAKRLLAGKEKRLETEDALTVDEVLDIFINEGKLGNKAHRKQFVDTFLLPQIASSWGLHQVSDARKMLGHYAFHYLMIIKGNWYDMPGGIHSYFDKLKKMTEETINLQTNCPINKIEPIAGKKKPQYKLLKDDGSYVCDKEGQAIIYDAITLAAPAYEMAHMIADIEELQDLREKLLKVEYYETTIVLHQDKKFLCPGEAVVNINYEPDANQAATTICKAFKEVDGKESVVYKTWVLNGQPMPNNIKHTAKFMHPGMNENYYEAQCALEASQGIGGIFFGGILAGTNDSHESGIRVAIRVAAMLQQSFNLGNNELLDLFPETVSTVADWQPPKSKVQKSKYQDKLLVMKPVAADTNKDDDEGKDKDRTDSLTVPGGF